MRFWLLSPFIVQALAIFVDEFWFHQKRVLPKWERIGHPLDTLGLISCLLIPVIFPFQFGPLALYAFASTISSLWITKDEKIHAQYCDWKEHWLHSVLFLIHPIVLIEIAFLWSRPSEWNWAGNLVLLQILLMLTFLSYQIIYWNFLWPKQKT